MLKRHSRTLGARRIARSLSFGSSTAIASRRRTDFRVAPARFWSQMRRYDPHVSWPYTKCNGARADGERCQARVDSGGVYCHHHDPARKTSAPTAALASLPARPAGVSSAPSVRETARPGRVRGGAAESERGSPQESHAGIGHADVSILGLPNSRSRCGWKARHPGCWPIRDDALREVTQVISGLQILSSGGQRWS